MLLPGYSRPRQSDEGQLRALVRALVRIQKQVRLECVLELQILRELGEPGALVVIRQVRVLVGEKHFEALLRVEGWFGERPADQVAERAEDLGGEAREQNSREWLKVVGGGGHYSGVNSCAGISTARPWPRVATSHRESQNVVGCLQK